MTRDAGGGREGVGGARGGEGDARSTDAPDARQEDGATRPDEAISVDGPLDLAADPPARPDREPTLLGQGNPCTGDEACSTGHCVDGVCCENQCDGTCVACSFTKTGKADGTCVFVLKDTDPDKECAATTFCCSSAGAPGRCANVCAGGQCKHDPANLIESCRDSTACTEDSCVESGGTSTCRHEQKCGCCCNTPATQACMSPGMCANLGGTCQ
jgi:hypothetical protein